MTVTGGRSFEVIQKLHLKKVKATLRGAKFNNIDTEVFSLLTQRQKGESFSSYWKRSRKLNALSVDDKQRLINAEKKRRAEAVKQKQKMLDEYLGTSSTLSATQELESQVAKNVSTTLSNKLSRTDLDIFQELTQRNNSESMFAHLKRVKSMNRLPVENKKQLIDQHKKTALLQQQKTDSILQEYLELTPREKIEQETVFNSQRVEESLQSSSQQQKKQGRGQSR